jgi:tetratricopeptide (TPR) repeat protein
MQNGETTKVGRQPHIHIVSLLINILLPALFFIALTSCSTKNNTAGSRFYHALTTRYNVYFNGNEAYKAGVKAKEQSAADNYSDNVIPFYISGDNASAKESFNRAIEKSQKSISLHSIRRKPKRKQGKNYTAEYKRWLASKEFNPFMHNAWMLMGKAQFQKGDFAAAAATFAYTARLYSNNRSISSEARIWLAQCYTMQGWFYDAEELLLEINNDSLPHRLSSSYASAHANLLIESKRYREALPYLSSAISAQKNKRNKARLYYLEGQLYQTVGDRYNAYKAYSKTISLSPPYDIEINARIRRTEVTGSGMTQADIKKSVDKLHHMARSEKNKPYVDLIYYAAGNMFMSVADTVNAINEYRNGAERDGQGKDKGVISLALGNIYMSQGRYKEARQAYARTIGVLSREHEQYSEITKRTRILDALVPHIETIELQDSLQHLASLDSVSRMKVIENIIAQVVRKENEEAKKLDNERRIDGTLEQQSISAKAKDSYVKMSSTSSDKSWYFYNTQTVAQGKNDFARLWGDRKNEDNWRRRNKTVVSLDDFESVDYGEIEDNNVRNISSDDKGKSTVDSADGKDDNKSTDFYLKQIPLTDEAVKHSNEKLSEALFRSAIIYKDDLENYGRAESAFKRLLYDFPDYSQNDEAYYNYFLMLGRCGRGGDAAAVRRELIDKLPDSKYAVMLSDSDYERNAAMGRKLEDSLYAHTYDLYKRGDYVNVKINAELSANKYPTGKHRPKFMFLNAMTSLHDGDRRSFLNELKELVRSYPENEITDIAAHILKGVGEGRRLLTDGSTSFGDIWGRNVYATAADSLSEATDSISAFKTEINVPYLFIIAYENGTVDENRLLYEIARYNFTSFLVKEFDLEMNDINGIGRLIVSGFSNMDEALYYQRRLYATPEMSTVLSGMRSNIISEENYELLNKYHSFDEYNEFYHSTFGSSSASDYSIEKAYVGGGAFDDPISNLPDDGDDEEDDDDLNDDKKEDNKTIYIY